MTTELSTARVLSQQLTELFSHINNMWGNTVELIYKAYNLAKQEGYTPLEAKQMVFDNVTFLSKSQIYKALPEECKDQTKASAGRVSHNEGVSVPNLEQKTDNENEFDTKDMGVVITESESSSESATGPNGEEVEQEVETPKTIETVIIPTIEYEELKEAVRNSTQPIPAYQYRPATIPYQTFVAPIHIPQIVKAITKSKNGEVGLVFHWTSDGQLEGVEPGNYTTTTKSEDGETSD